MVKTSIEKVKFYEREGQTRENKEQEKYKF